jgi:cobyrinic acid a,c-diamide synthase
LDQRAVTLAALPISKIKFSMQPDGLEFPRLIIAALRGGSGKTILSVGIIAALKALGKAVSPFKKGPDYIDAGWLALAAGRPCYNLDTFMVACIRVLSISLLPKQHRNH